MNKNCFETTGMDSRYHASKYVNCKHNKWIRSTNETLTSILLSWSSGHRRGATLTVAGGVLNLPVVTSDKVTGWLSGSLDWLSSGIELDPS